MAGLRPAVEELLDGLLVDLTRRAAGGAVVDLMTGLAFPFPVAVIGRAESPALSLGGGIHYCLGAGLARLEAQLLFSGLLTRFPVIELAGAPTYRDGLSVRGLVELPLRLTSAGVDAALADVG